MSQPVGAKQASSNDRGPGSRARDDLDGSQAAGREPRGEVGGLDGEVGDERVQPERAGRAGTARMRVTASPVRSAQWWTVNPAPSMAARSAGAETRWPRSGWSAHGS